MSEFTIGKKAYAALFITDYQKAKTGWRRFVDTIINNLYGRTPSEGWVKFHDLPPIQFSVIDIAENKDRAFRMMGQSTYDVVIVNNILDGRPIGSGMLKRFREIHPGAMFIPLLDASQKAGFVKQDGSISTGEGLSNMYQASFYNGMFKLNFSMKELISLILSGGREKEDAGIYYGIVPALDTSKQDMPKDPEKEKNEDIKPKEVEKELKPTLFDMSLSEPEDNKEQQIKAESKAPGLLTGKVMFAKEKMILIEVEDPIEKRNLSMCDLVGMPVAVPYAKAFNLLPGE